jgi:hypothetical protein
VLERRPIPRHFLSLPDPMHKVALLGLGKVFMIPG